MHKGGPIYRYRETSTNRAIHLLVEPLFSVYHFASDIGGEGLGVELLNASGDVVAEVFRRDADQSILVSTLDNNILPRDDSRYVGSDDRARRCFEMNQYLVRYRRSTGDLLQFEDLGPDRAAAMGRRLEEERVHKDDPDIEVVLLTASSREALIRTHARYFKSVPELAAALAAALPVIPEA